MATSPLSCQLVPAGVWGGKIPLESLFIERSISYIRTEHQLAEVGNGTLLAPEMLRLHLTRDCHDIDHVPSSI